MLSLVLLGLSLLAADREPLRAEAKAVVEPAEALSKYNELKEKTPNTAAAQWKLALWCEQNGLPAEAFVHFAAVALLDPSREAAWKRLGYKKHGGRWKTDAQVVDEAEQKKADKKWGAKLKKIHKEIHGGKHQNEALDEVAKIEDPRALASVYREFGAGGAIDQAIAIQILGQINTPDSSKVLAVLAVYGKTPEVRRRATETLRGRNPDEFLALLVNLMTDPLEYEVRPVGGPGSPGVLFVQGERFNVRRFYAPPAPNLQVRPGDSITYDDLGMPVINHPLGISTGPRGVPGSKTLVENDQLTLQVSVREAMLQAQQGAVNAQLQLQNDVAAIENLNTTRKKFNDVVMNVAKDATGKDLGSKPKDWRKAIGSRKKYEDAPSKEPQKPIIDEVVPLAYMPQFGRLGFIRQVYADS
jgi:hypothetical protein